MESISGHREARPQWKEFLRLERAGEWAEYARLPDGLAAQRAYGVLTQVLEQSHKWAIGRLVLTGNQQLVVRAALTIASG
ncbi:MAG: hypothetical protein HY040_07450 [Planctomycetes bacterium]|nr:hypothetical protein [Planctomycetota bacterium]